jgi:hypothetical protein
MQTPDKKTQVFTHSSNHIDWESVHQEIKNIETLLF